MLQRPTVSTIVMCASLFIMIIIIITDAFRGAEAQTSGSKRDRLWVRFPQPILIYYNLERAA